MGDTNKLLINNTGVDLRGFIEEAIWAAINANPESPMLPDELSDLLVVAPVVGFTDRWTINPA